MQFPHVARFRDRIEPEGVCDAEQTDSRLQVVRVLLRMIGPLTKHPGFVRPHAIDSIGTYLVGKDRAEACRARLMGEDPTSPPLRATLKKRSHEVVSIAQSESLTDRDRLLCTPIRGRDEVARRLGADDRSLSELAIEFGGGAKLVLRQHIDPLRAVVMLTSAEGGARKTLDAKLKPDQRLCLARCFEGAGLGRLGVVRDEPLTAHFVKTSQRGFHDLPVWMCEHLATIAQDVFRVHALLSGASKTVSRMVLANKASVFKFDLTSDDPRTLIKTVLHPASGGCICGLHRRESASEFKGVEFRIRICEEALVLQKDGETRACPRHYVEDDPTTHGVLEAQAVNPGRCCAGLAFELWCTHDRTKDPRAGLRIPLPIPAPWMVAPLRELAAACCALTLPKYASGQVGIQGRVQDLKATVDGIMQTFERERMAQGHVESLLTPWDQTAVWLFRNDTPSFGSDGKIKGKRVRPEFHDVGPTHGHLFKRMKV